MCVCVCFCVQLFANFLKRAFFKKKGAKIGFFFSIFCVFSLNFENSLLLGLLKHYKIGVSANFGVFLLLPEKKRQKMITGISGFVYLSKNGRFVTQNCFSKFCSLKPLFL